VQNDVFTYYQNKKEQNKKTAATPQQQLDYAIKRIYYHISSVLSIECSYSYTERTAQTTKIEEEIMEEESKTSSS